MSKIYLSFYCLLVFLSACSNDAVVKNENQHLSIAQINLEALETGDIVLKRGNGRISKMITDYFKEKVPLSHCGVIICDTDSTYVVHSVAGSYARKDGVQTILLKDLLKDCKPNFFYVVRKKASSEERAKFAAQALAFSTQEIPFDDMAENNDMKKMSCTELIYWCQMQSYGKSDLKSISFNGKDVFVFNGFLDTAQYKIIKHL